MSIADYGFAIWETFYVTILSTAFALVLGLPLGATRRRAAAVLGLAKISFTSPSSTTTPPSRMAT